MGQSPEDRILSVVFNRLKAKLELTFKEIADWTGIPQSSLCDLSAGCAQRFMSRIPRLGKYFREVHKLEFVNADYLLTGNEEDRERLKVLNKMIEDLEKENKDYENQLGFWKLVEEKRNKTK